MTDVNKALKSIAVLRATINQGAIKSAAVAYGLKLDDYTDDEQTLYMQTYERVLVDTGDNGKAQLAADGAIRRARMKLAVKAQMVGDDVLVSGWGILFGTNQTKDLDEQYFPPDGDYGLEFYQDAPLLYQHGRDRRYGVRPIGQRVHVERYQHGLWATHKLFKEHPFYDKTVKQIENGELAYSSDSIAHLVYQGLEPDGGLTIWWLCGWSLVDTPAEPGLSKVVIEAPETV